MQSGDISRIYKRIMSDFPQYNPKLISDPSTPVAKGRSGSAYVPPWVVTLENFLSDEEGEAFVNGCASHFDRSLAGDQLSPVRTSQQFHAYSSSDRSAPPMTPSPSRSPVPESPQFPRS